MSVPSCPRHPSPELWDSGGGHRGNDPGESPSQPRAGRHGFPGVVAVPPAAPRGEGGAERLTALTPEAIKLRTLETLRRIVINASRQRPIVFVVEDLHWIDKTSEELFASFIEHLPGATIMFLSTYRPGFRSPWMDKSYAHAARIRPEALLKAALLYSTAKFVISPSTIAQTLVTPLARWEGYAAERREILEFIRHNGIQNAIFLSTDDHRNLIIPVLVDRFADPTPVALEFVTGPIAAFTDADGFRFFFGPGPLSDAVIAANNSLLDIAGAECRHTDAYSYGVVEVSAAGEVTLTLKDAAGGTILGEQAGNALCV